jgi:hypothetical protein
MPSDTEITDSDSSILDTEITLDPEIIAISSLRWSELYKGVRSYLRYPRFAPPRRLR